MTGGEGSGREGGRGKAASLFTSIKTHPLSLLSYHLTYAGDVFWVLMMLLWHRQN